MAGTAGNQVLLLGLDPRTVPGVDAGLVEAAIAMGDVRLHDQGFATDYCLVAPDEAGEREIEAALRQQRYACVVIGGGIRKPDPFLEMFERVVNLCRVHQPGTPVAFNTTGENSVDAVLRWLPPANV
jgi:hypothetical protein